MKRVDQVVAWLILVLAVRAAVLAPREFHTETAPSATGFWMLSSSLLFAVCGALSLLRIRYGAVAPGLRAAAALTAVAFGALFLTAGIIGGETAPSAVVAVLLFLSAAMAFRTGRAA
jgi:hypothetical protein